MFLVCTQHGVDRGGAEKPEQPWNLGDQKRAKPEAITASTSGFEKLSTALGHSYTHIFLLSFVISYHQVKDF